MGRAIIVGENPIVENLIISDVHVSTAESREAQAKIDDAQAEIDKAKTRAEDKRERQRRAGYTPPLPAEERARRDLARDAARPPERKHAVRHAAWLARTAAAHAASALMTPEERAAAKARRRAEWKANQEQK